MSDDIEFVEGLRVYPPRDGAPSFVKLNMTIDAAALKAWLSGRSGTIRLDVKESRGGKLYACVNAWKPRSEQTPEPPRSALREPAAQEEQDEFADDIPFN